MEDNDNMANEGLEDENSKEDNKLEEEDSNIEETEEEENEEEEDDHDNDTDSASFIKDVIASSGKLLQSKPSDILFRQKTLITCHF